MWLLERLESELESDAPTGASGPSGPPAPLAPLAPTVKEATATGKPSQPKQPSPQSQPNPMVANQPATRHISDATRALLGDPFASMFASCLEQSMRAVGFGGQGVVGGQGGQGEQNADVDHVTKLRVMMRIGRLLTLAFKYVFPLQRIEYCEAREGSGEC